MQSRHSRLGLFTQIKEDFNVPKYNDPALESNLEIIFNYPGVWAIIHYRIANRFLYTTLLPFAMPDYLQNVQSS